MKANTEEEPERNYNGLVRKTWKEREVPKIYLYSDSRENI